MEYNLYLNYNYNESLQLVHRFARTSAEKNKALLAVAYIVDR